MYVCIVNNKDIPLCYVFLYCIFLFYNFAIGNYNRKLNNRLEFMKKLSLLAVAFLMAVQAGAAPRFVTFQKDAANGLAVVKAGKPINILFDNSDDEGLGMAVNSLCADMERVSGTKAQVVSSPERECVIVGTLNSSFIQQMIKNGKLSTKDLQGKREKYLLLVVDKPMAGIDKALVIVGSDKRGSIYGVYELSQQMGVSPWYWWMDVPTQKHADVYINKGIYTDGEPKVEYRGIFINDEWPSFGNWATTHFGGINSKMYAHVFELILRLKGNFMWPAMWSSAFFDDDKDNGVLANKMGIVMGTSHHEPMDLAQRDWKRRGEGAWNFQTNREGLLKFWKSGIERSKNWETIVTLGMRGDGDMPMDESDDNRKLLENVVAAQRKIITDVTGKPVEKTPQVWALYKEVQDYYDQGMKVPDDVTLLLCDDNWGNVRRIPSLSAPKRKGGYGMYYHFDYVGGPRCVTWLNTNSMPRVWEQMNLTYHHGVDKMWIVNVGDLKPMEYPIQFWFDMAWNPEEFTADNLAEHSVRFCASVFGEKYAEEAARLLRTYAKLNHRVTPEQLNDQTYSMNYGEWERVVGEYNQLVQDVEALEKQMPADMQDALFQLLGYPIKACSNLYDMYYAVAMNKRLAKKKNPLANAWADRAEACFKRDAALMQQYHRMNNGKWNHMMDQIHIGYTSWNTPKKATMPKVTRLEGQATESITLPSPVKLALTMPALKQPTFVEKDGCISMEAAHYTRSTQGKDTQWTVIPELGRTLSGLTTMPTTASVDNMSVEYDMEVTSDNDFAKVIVRCAPTLNFNTTGLRYAVSIDGKSEQTVNINGDYKGDLGEIQKLQVIDTQTIFRMGKGKHTLRIRPLDNGLVFQKIMIDLGGMRKSFLGAPETLK